ncbi:MAG TPA: (5-formylfuran-3-yl)methyl phosphate synthase [Methanothrix sp.]|nr:(5-formylfuran-3-yl)methyl phosphate synthase [Methanothrix sp.]HRW81881.1 (5-formylfuran-3-yl)methyl phosphate synthase [Methanothrix sp.]
MRLLVSPINIKEAEAAMAGGADILDVKNPKEGSLGANFPWVIRSVAEVAGGKMPVSATIGDFDYKPGTASLAALGAAFSGADYIKVGLLKIQTQDEAGDMLGNIARSVKEFDAEKKLVAAAYSDFSRVGSISPMDLPEVAAECGADVVMVDTAVKDGKSTFEFMTESQIADFIDLGHDFGLDVAIAGTIKFEDLDLLKRVAPEIVGVRGAVCGGDRSGQIKEELVRRMKADLS